MLDKLERLPADTILGLAAACRADPNPAKVDLSVRIYMDAQGQCPAIDAVRQAPQALVAQEVSQHHIPSPYGQRLKPG